MVCAAVLSHSSELNANANRLIFSRYPFTMFTILVC